MDEAREYLVPVEVVVVDLLDRPGEHRVLQIRLPHVSGAVADGRGCRAPLKRWPVTREQPSKQAAFASRGEEDEGEGGLVVAVLAVWRRSQGGGEKQSKAIRMVPKSNTTMISLPSSRPDRPR